MSETPANTDAETQGHVSVAIRLENDDNLPLLLANNFFVRWNPMDGFMVSFAQVHGPYVVQPSEEELAEGLTAKIVARLLIPPVRMREFVDLMTEQLESYERTQAEAVQ